MARKRKDRTSVESAATVDTIDTVETVDSTGNIPEDIGDSSSSSNNNNNIDADNNEKPPRRKSPRQKKLLKQNFKGMQGSGSDEHYKVGPHGGAYRGKATMKRAPKCAV